MILLSLLRKKRKGKNFLKSTKKKWKKLQKREKLTQKFKISKLNVQLNKFKKWNRKKHKYIREKQLYRE